MRSRILLILSLSAVWLPLPMAAQVLPADDFFHAGAQFYLSNNIPAALERVTNGLAVYPNDVKLKKLEELLKQQQQSQQNQQQQKDQQQQQKSDEQKQQEQSQPQEKEKEDQQQQSAKSGEENKPQEQQETEQQQAQLGEMTEQQARQLLDAQKGHEQVLIFKPGNEKQKARTKTLKDW